MKKPEELQKDIQRSDMAKQVLNHPLVVEYFDIERRSISTELEQSVVDEKRERELIMYLKALGKFERKFIQYMRGGKKAQSLLEKLIRGSNV